MHMARGQAQQVKNILPAEIQDLLNQLPVNPVLSGSDY
jgi:hypothetical protein